MMKQKRFLIVAALCLFFTTFLVNATDTASAQNIPKLPGIYYSIDSNQINIEVENLSKEDVVDVLWNGATVSSAIEEMESSNSAKITETQDGFVISLTLADDFEGDFGLLLSNGTILSIPVSKENENTKRRIALPTVQVYGYVYYRKSGCWFWGCWKKASGAIIKVSGKSSFGLGVPSTTTYSNSNGYYDTGKLQGCGKFTVIAEYGGKSKSYSKSPWCTATGNKKYKVKLYIR